MCEPACVHAHFDDNDIVPSLVDDLDFNYYSDSDDDTGDYSCEPFIDSSHPTGCSTVSNHVDTEPNVHIGLANGAVSVLSGAILPPDVMHSYWLLSSAHMHASCNACSCSRFGVVSWVGLVYVAVRRYAYLFRCLPCCLCDPAVSAVIVDSAAYALVITDLEYIYDPAIISVFLPAACSFFHRLSAYASVMMLTAKDPNALHRILMQHVSGLSDTISCPVDPYMFLSSVSKFECAYLRYSRAVHYWSFWTRCR